MARSKGQVDEAIEHIVTTGIAPALSAAGFERADLAFVRSRGDVHQVVDVQRSLRNEDNRGRFTLNLAVASLEITRLWHAERVARGPASEQSWLISQRVGALIDPPADRWWDLDDDTDLEAVAATMKEIIASPVLPFFEIRTLRSCAGLLRHLETGHPLPGRVVNQEELHALLLHHQGRQADAVAFLERMARRSRGKPWLEGYVNRIDRLAARLDETTVVDRAPPVRTM